MQAKTVCRERVLEQELIDALWLIYESAFVGSKSLAVQDQICYSRDTFGQAMRDVDYRKFIVYDGEEAVGIGLATNDLDKANIAYVNPFYFQHRYPQEYSERRFWYFTAIAVVPHLQGKSQFITSMTSEMTSFISDVEGIVVFDHSLETNPQLPQMLVTLIERAQKIRKLPTDTAEYSPLGGQSYGMIRFTKTR